MHIFRHSIFSDKATGHGGNKRTSQLSEILNNHNVSYSWLSYQYAAGHLAKAFFVLRGAFFLLKNYKWIKCFINFNLLYHSYYIGLVKHSIINASLHSKQRKVFIWESTVQKNWFFPILFKRLGFEVIAFPHNIESFTHLERNTSTPKTLRMLNREVLMLSMADRVFTISLEERWLLRNLGISAKFVPFENLSEQESYFAQIRKKRDSINHRGDVFLLLGSAVNTPTKLGLIKLIQLLDCVEDKSLLFYVAGYGTDDLRKELSVGTNFSFEGTVSDARLAELLSISKAVIINQPPTSGALTKIPELLSCNVPVIANLDAARTYYSNNGIIIYNDSTLLRIIADTTDRADKHISETDNFVEFIMNVAKAS